MVSLCDDVGCHLLQIAARARRVLGRLLASALQVQPPTQPPEPPAGTLPAVIRAIADNDTGGASRNEMVDLLVELYAADHEASYTLSHVSEAEQSERGNQRVECLSVGLMVGVAAKASDRGIRVTNWLWYQSSMTAEVHWASKGFTANMKRKYKCPKCLCEFRFDLSEVTRHDAGCHPGALAESDGINTSSLKRSSNDKPQEQSSTNCYGVDNDYSYGERVGGALQGECSKKRRVECLSSEEPVDISLSQNTKNDIIESNPDARQQFECPKCLKTFVFTKAQADDHIKRCSTYLFRTLLLIVYVQVIYFALVSRLIYLYIFVLAAELISRKGVSGDYRSKCICSRVDLPKGLAPLVWSPKPAITNSHDHDCNSNSAI